MKLSKVFDRRAGFSLAALGMLVGAVAPAALPAFASAGTLTTRSITMSDSTANATSVKYKLTFTPATTAGATGGFFVDFCSDTPLIVNTCTAPTALDTAGLTADTGTVTSAAANSIKLVTALTAATPFTVTFSGIHNPSTVGTFYARVMTYDGTTNPIGNHTSTIAQGAYSDNGSVALSTTNQMAVTAYVLESMTFCVSSTDPGKNCATNVNNPSMTIGETSGNVTALSTAAVSTKNAYAQLSTNASGGAVVNLKSDAVTCGGLYRNGVSDATHCNIPPVTTAGAITAGTANFGVKVGNATNPSDAAAGDMAGTLTQSGSYSAANYFFGYAAGDTSGVTGPYGDTIFQSGSTPAPVSNKNVPLTFGATISNNTPAGIYGAKLNLIATGTF